MPNLTTRAAGMWRPKTFDQKERTVEVIAATEAPVPVFDWERYEIVSEVLIVAGVVVPGRGQVPLLDTHNRNSVGNVLGSVRGFSAENDMLTATVTFADDQAARDAAAKVEGGHLTDFSVGYEVIKSVFIPEGETAIISGREWTGPLRVTSEWKLKELSIAPIGADDRAKARAEQGGTMPDKPVKTETERAVEAERDRVSEINALCSRHECNDLAAGLIENGATTDAARKAVLDRLIDRNAPAREIGYRAPAMFGAEIIHDETDKRVDAAVDGYCLRAGVRLDKPAPGSNLYRAMSISDLAKECLQAAGERVNGVGKSRIIKLGLQQRAAGVGNFPYILANTAGKILRVSYEEAPGEYERWCNVTDGVDFKQMERAQLSEAPALEQVYELQPYNYGAFGESKEVFQIYKYGKLFAISREALVNDDLGAFTRVPRAFALAAKRHVNQAAYGVLTANAAMNDGNNLFSTAHGNYVANGSGAAPGITTLSAGRLAIRTQSGLNGATLNISPRFLIVPAALETTADQLLNSIADLTDNKNSGVVNPFHKKLEVITESYLDSVDAATWYMAADPRQIDTVEVCFLEGRRWPYLESRDGWTVDGVEYKVRIELGVAAIDYRGLYCNDGN